MLTKIDNRIRVIMARKQLIGDTRTAITAINPDGNIFDQMDQADAQVEAMTDKEVIAALVALGLVWSGKFWMKAELA